MKILKSAFVLFFALIIAISCKKENIQDNPPEPNTNDSLIIVKSNFNEVDTLQDIYKSSNGFEYYLYGKRRADGKITKVSSMAIKQKNKSDSILNIVYDDSLRVSEYYFTVNGKRDTSLISLSYSHDSINVCQYKVDWATGERLTRYKVQLKKDGTNSVTPINSEFYKLKSAQDLFDEVLAIDGASNANGYGFIITVAVFTALGAKVAKVPGAFIGFCGGVAYYALKPKSAAASEISQTPLGSPNDPSSLFNQLKTVKDLFTFHNWKYESRFSDGVSDLESCELNDIILFGANGIMTEYSSCHPAEYSFLTYTWHLYNNDQSIQIADPAGVGGFFNLTITKLTLSRLEMSGNDDLGGVWKFTFIAAL